MDVQRKSIQNLTDSLDEKREELSALYRQFGERLLQESANPEGSGALSRDRVDTWRNLRASRDEDTRAILEIKSTLSRQQELGQFRKELEKNLAEIESSYNEQLRKAGKAFYEQYTEKDSEFFSATYEKASVEGSAILQLEQKQDDLRKELEASGFLGKMVAQFKMASLASAVRQRRDRVMKILEDGARTLADNGILERKFESGELDEQFAGIMSALRETRQRRMDLLQREKDLCEDISSMKDTLELYKASVNHQRRLDELHAQIRETDKRIDTLTVLSAREYCDKFLDEDGRSVLGSNREGNSFSDMGMYSRELENVAGLRQEIAVVRKNIEVLEDSLRIESLDRNIASMERSISDYEKKMEHYRELIETQKKNIVSAREERLSLIENREAIEKDLGKGSRSGT